MDKKPFKNIGLYLFFLGTIAGVLLIVGLLVSNAAASNTTAEDNSVLYEGLGANLLDHGGSFNGCMVERYNQVYSKSETSLNCTSNDVVLAQYDLLLGPSTCFEGEDITITLLGEFESTSDQRWDVGMFIATDGGNPNSLGGTCYNDYLHPVSMNNSDLNLSGGSGPFYNGELSEDPGDTCGDIQQGQNAFFQTGQITIKCQDSNGNGIADVNTCTVWANSRSEGTDNKPSCTSELDTTAETKAKCTCSNVEIAGLSVPLNGTIEVIKEVDPVDAPGAFNLQIDGATKLVNAQHGDTTGPVTVSAGSSTDPSPIGDTHTVGETAGAGTDLSLFDTEIFCVDQEQDMESAQNAGPLDVFVEPDDEWVCRIINTYNVTPTPTNTATFTPTPTETPTPTGTQPVATLPATDTPTPTETSPPSTKEPTDKPPTATATSRPPSGTSTPVTTLAQPTSPAETPQIIIPETGLDLSLSSGNSGFNFLTILMLGLGFVGTGLMFYGVATQISRNRPKK